MRRLSLETAELPPAGDVLYPILLSVSDDLWRIQAMPFARSVAERIAADLPQTADFGRLLLARLTPLMRERGYAPLPHAEDAVSVWQGKRVENLPSTAVCRPSDAEDLPWALTHSRADLPDTAFLAVSGGVVAAAAWYTAMGIAVETAPAFRRQGFARTVVAALTAERCAGGEPVLYRCAETNAASMALAASLGFIPVSCEYRPGFRLL